MSGGTQPARPARVKLTARGSIVFILLVSLAGHTLTSWTGVAVLTGISFVSACLIGVLLLNRRDLLSLVVTPPLVFLVAAVAAEAVRALGSGSVLQTFALGMFTTLSSGAPWLFAGSAVVLAVAWRRGLRDNVRTLRDELQAPRPTPAATAQLTPQPSPHPDPQPGPQSGPQPGKEPPSPKAKDTRNKGKRRNKVEFMPEPEGYFEPRVYGTTRETDSPKP
ncbi:DUF6542 domain-containing protein [Sinosporangium siamense]|uniref:DUF6542 domain-containing protein n=1 Tax=Sinosporangium siamense TaxID=1367973 RepID=A0A919VCI1_9ACTN|nr:DUF6542 domain-containing protein [Sinosporangium siamense]GII93154.1 hypothetical protein Ssi02_33850 [Sinosporangium siamense]